MDRYLRPETINEIVWEGNIVESAPLTSISDDDLSPDILELKMLGIYDDEELTKKVLGNQTKEKRLIVSRPATRKVTVDGEDKLQINMTEDIYTEEDLAKLTKKEEVVAETVNGSDEDIQDLLSQMSL